MFAVELHVHWSLVFGLWSLVFETLNLELPAAELKDQRPKTKDQFIKKAAIAGRCR
jgi:hypothetical protein